MGSGEVFAEAAWRRAKWSFVTRRARRGDAVHIVDGLDGAASGDLVLARVEQTGSHRRLQLQTGRHSDLYPGDVIVAAVGARYAPDQFEGVAEIGRAGADLLAGGGIIGRMLSRHAKLSAPTRVAPIGLLADAAGVPLNVRRYALRKQPCPPTLTVIAAIGTSMNSGKTTAAASLVHGLARAGHRVAAIKATGTGACGDYNAYADAGAQFVADFTDAGMATTYRQPIERIEAGLATLLGHAAAAGCEVAIVEIADGLFQQETAALLAEPRVRSSFAGFVFAAPDAMAATGGCAWLHSLGVAPAVLTGTLSLSPLGAAEAEAATGHRVVSREELRDPAVASALLCRIRRPAPARLSAAAAAAPEIAA